MISIKACARAHCLHRVIGAFPAHQVCALPRRQDVFPGWDRRTATGKKGIETLPAGARSKLSLKVRASTALIKAATLALMGLWVLGSTVWHTFFLGTPRAEVIGLIGVLALAVNVASVLILIKHKDGDANVRSVWLCSRNDAIGNVAVMLAALGVWATASGWPDVLVAAILASLFLNSASKILRQALGEWRLTRKASSEGVVAT